VLASDFLAGTALPGGDAGVGLGRIAAPLLSSLLGGGVLVLVLVLMLGVLVLPLATPVGCDGVRAGQEPRQAQPAQQPQQPAARAGRGHEAGEPIERGAIHRTTLQNAFDAISTVQVFRRAAG
jgi:hypothetical protein